ncbi:hypothetical protein [Phenylobacterium soli]|uniref:DUF2306 domain-containing protein n=1 Tax=Phenylobacterium soli TaxID=2170551 RepID=A0A328ALV6_9CAUL|nr:hypothetical protein [Phenylobacterium soli]RAK55953.1 hypothetical protein DJ017_16270 [Phenylobacterium soli]
MFEHWDSFYLLVGGAAGALIGLLFIVATLTRGRDRDSALHGASVYMSPVVLHLALVLSISALAAVPGISPRTGGLLVGAAGLVGVVASARVVYHLAIAKTFAGAHWTDLWCYGVAALAADLALTTAASAVWWGTTRIADLAIGASLVGILLITIRNAWDLVTWISAVNNAEGTPPAAG